MARGSVARDYDIGAYTLVSVTCPVAVIQYLITVPLKRKACFSSHQEGSLSSWSGAAGHMASPVKRRERILCSALVLPSPSSL